MKVLHLIPYFSDAFGGPVHSTKMLTRQMMKHGHEVVIYTTNLADKSGRTCSFENSEFNVEAFPVSWSVGDYFYTRGMKVAIAAEEFDLIHAHCYRNHQSDLGAWLSREKDKPLVFSAHGTLPKLPGWRDAILKGFYDAARRGSVLRCASRVIALSLREMNQYRAFGVPHERIARIHHGIDSDLFRPVSDSWAARQQFALGDGPLVLYVGRLHERKGLQHLLPAFRRVVKEFAGAKLILAGPDYGYGEQLSHLINNARIQDRVTLLGSVPHERMPELYGACDVIVLPALYEAFGHVIAEAGACGKAIIATKWGWAAEFFEDRKDALLIDGYGDVDALAAAMVTLLRDPLLRHQLGARAREKITRSLSWEVCTRAHEQLFEELVHAS